MARKMAPARELLSEIMEGLGYPVDDSTLSLGFFAYGMDSLDMVVIRDKLGELLGRELPATMLLDFPNVQDLSEKLDKMRGIGERAQAQVITASLDAPRIEAEGSKTPVSGAEGRLQRGESGALSQRGAKSPSGHLMLGEDALSWGSMRLDDLIRIQAKMLKLYSLPQHQNKIEDLSAKHSPDLSRYLSEVEHIVRTVEGTVLFSAGLIHDMKPSSVQEGCQRLAWCVQRLGRGVPQVQKHNQQLASLLKLDSFGISFTPKMKAPAVPMLVAPAVV